MSKQLETVSLLPGQYELPVDVAGSETRYKPIEDITGLAFDIRANGQLQPVVVYKDTEGKIKFVGGRTRAAAVEMIRDGFEYNGKPYAPIADFPLRAEVIEPRDSKDAYIKGISDNAKRNSYSPVDYAIIIRNLRENTFTKSNATAKICEMFGRDKSWVSRISSLLTLPKVALDLVHLGEDKGGISYSVGNEMTKESIKLTEDDITALCAEPEKLTIKAINDYVEKRDAGSADGDSGPTDDGTGGGTGESAGTGEASTAPKKRTIADLQEIFAVLGAKDNEKYKDTIVRKIAVALSAFAVRKIGEEKLFANIDKALADCAK